MSKGKKSCSILQWLKNYDRKFWDAIEEACVSGLFKASKEAGVTFLYPTNADLRNKIISLLNENDYEGVRMLQSLVIIGYLPDGEAWNAQKDDIPNKLRVKIPVTSTKGDRVYLSNGAELKRMSDNEFSPRQDRQNMAIWEYKGKEPITGGDATEFKYAKAGAVKPKPKRGGMYHKNTPVFGLAKQCEGKAVALLDAGKYNECNPYVNLLVSYLSYLEENNSSEYQRCLECLSYCPEATFYNIFQPYKLSSSPPSYSGWIGATHGITLVESTANKYLEYVTAAANLESSRANRIKACHDRQPLLENRYPSILRSKLVATYNNNDDKAQKDEILFMVTSRLPEILALPNRESANSFRDLCFEIEILQRSGKVGCSIITGDLTNVNDHCDAPGFYSSAVLFVMSDCFMHAPFLMDNLVHQEEVATDTLGCKLTPMSISKVTLETIKDDSTFVLMQDPSYKYLKALAENQTNVNVQTAFAEALGSLKIKDIGNNLKDALLKVCNELTSSAA